jgi:hypothetical protein
MKKADAANGEPEALEEEHKTGGAQTEKNKRIECQLNLTVARVHICAQFELLSSAKGPRRQPRRALGSGKWHLANPSNDHAQHETSDESGAGTVRKSV